jgi:hypothetical protein
MQMEIRRTVNSLPLPCPASFVVSIMGAPKTVTDFI